MMVPEFFRAVMWELDRSIPIVKKAANMMTLWVVVLNLPVLGARLMIWRAAEGYRVQESLS